MYSKLNEASSFMMRLEARKKTAVQFWKFSHLENPDVIEHYMAAAFEA